MWLGAANSDGGTATAAAGRWCTDIHEAAACRGGTAGGLGGGSAGCLDAGTAAGRGIDAGAGGCAAGRPAVPLVACGGAAARGWVARGTDAFRGGVEATFFACFAWLSVAGSLGVIGCLRLPF